MGQLRTYNFAQMLFCLCLGSLVTARPRRPKRTHGSKEVSEALVLGGLILLCIVIIKGTAVARHAQHALQLLYELLVTRIHASP